MNSHLDALFAAFDRHSESTPADLVAALRELPEPGDLPSPWSTWTLIGLVRHRERQFWVADIMRSRLGGAPADLAAHGAFGHPEGVPQRGSVPGIPEWEYYFHGRGCCISHKVHGDAIDVDFFDDSAEYFDTWFYQRYLESVTHPELAEQRLCELHATVSTVGIAIDDLLAIGALTPFPGRDRHPYRLSDLVVSIAGEIDAFLAAWLDGDRRLWLAALIGDWLAADEAASGRPELTSITGPRAVRCRELRQQRLHVESGQQLGADALRALADLQARDLDRHLEQALRAPPSGLVSAALDIVDQLDDSVWCEPVYELFRRVRPDGQLPQPHIWMTSLKFLLRHNHHSGEAVAALSRAGGTEVGEAVLLSLEHAPELVLPLIRKALLHKVPIRRTEVAAILALINAPWSRRELLRALEASDDQERTADARAALLESGDAEARRAVRAWEERNPHEEETGSYVEINGRRHGPLHTFGELSLRHRASRIRYEMDKLHDRVMKLKDIIPPEPRPWWKIWGE